jgi:hypothetical protein
MVRVPDTPVNALETAPVQTDHHLTANARIGAAGP